ncbi:hypothetical protein O0L34_g1727 [Tuta absoluta]|nr:hypothetical protein O0L34_g1727 [Tuta absoluta]
MTTIAKQEREAAAAFAATAAAAEAEINKMRELEERIKAPSIWGRVPCGIRFEDLQENRYEEAVTFLKRHYLNEEITWRSVKILEDKEATDEFIHNARIWMKDKMSIAVIKEGKEKLVGLLIMRIQDKNAFSRTFSKVKLTYNPIYTSVMKFYNELESKIKLNDQLDCKKYLKIYVVALKARYRHRGITKELLKSAKGLAASAFIPAMAGIFQTARMHKIAEEIGFEKYFEIYYIRYLIDGQIIFWDTGAGNYGAAIMGYRIPGVEERDQMLLFQSSTRFNVENDDVEDEDNDDNEEKKTDGEETDEKKTELTETDSDKKISW